MKLHNELYFIKTKRTGACAATYTLCLRPDSVIYKAHFPDRPITPGVCIVQIATEVASDFLGCPLYLTGIKNAKFVAVLSTDVTKEIEVELSSVLTEGNEVSFKCILRNAATVFAKLTLSCKKSL